MKICSTKTVQAIGGYITYNESLTTLGEWSKLEKVGGVLTLTNFGALTAIPEMAALQQSGGFYLGGLSKVPALNIPNVVFTAPEGESKATIYISRYCPALEKIHAPSSIDARLELDLTVNDKIPAFENKTTLAEADIRFQGNYSKDLVFSNWEKVIGNYSFVLNASGTYAKTISLPDLKEVGGYLYISWKSNLPTSRPKISLPELETVGGQLYIMFLVTEYDFTSLKTVCCSENPAYFNQEEATPPVGSIFLRIQTGGVTFPALTHVGGRGLALQGGNSLSCPLLTDIDGLLTLNAYKGNSNSVEMPILEKLGGVYFYNSTSLSDFSFFGKFIDGIPESNWTVSGCGYNPTYAQMKAGQYTKP
jgi:hypothetical protein